MPTVRTTFRPDQELVVTEREAYDLRQQGLLMDDDVAPERDPSAPGDAKDADELAKEQAQAKREELGEDKPKSQQKTSKNERS